jgi:hypothetical protein
MLLYGYMTLIRASALQRPLKPADAIPKAENAVGLLQAAPSGKNFRNEKNA